MIPKSNRSILSLFSWKGANLFLFSWRWRVPIIYGRDGFPLICCVGRGERKREEEEGPRKARAEARGAGKPEAWMEKGSGGRDGRQNKRRKRKRKKAVESKCTPEQKDRKRKTIKFKKTRVKDESEWTIIENHHEPIIDKELFEKVQKIRKKRKKESDKYNNGFKFVDVENNLYSGLLYCGRCGTAMYKRKGTSGTRKRPDSYLCKKYSNEGAIKDIRPDYGCKPHRIRIEYLDQIVNAYIDNLISNPEFKDFVMNNVKAINTNKVTLEKDINKHKQMIEKLEKQFKQVYEDKLNELIPEFIYKDKKQELEKKLKNEKEKLQETENKFNTLNKLEDKEDLIFKAIDDIKKNGLPKEAPTNKYRIGKVDPKTLKAYFKILDISTSKLTTSTPTS